ncbi:MAG: hypothetical protein U0L64_01775 [Clostridium sp.]|nr:hypothetical protein [Clostridium sp.]
MDRENTFLERLNSYINSLDEDYLIGISNKGIVKRANKDLEKLESIEYDIKDDYIEFKIDDITCSVNEEVQKYKCSCPSRTICKHIIMCYLYIMNNKEKIFGEIKEECNEEQLEEDKIETKEFIRLKEYNIENIKKNIGEKALVDIIRKINFGINYTITETAMVTVDFGEELIKVRLLDDIENSLCSCKSKELCIHKAEALILYKLYKNYISLEELNNYLISKEVLDYENIKKATVEIRNLIEEILISGISRVPETILDSINNMAIKCHNYDLPNFEKTLRGIREEIILYFNKNAAFKNEKLLNILTTLYIKTLTLENSNNFNIISEIIGEFKSSYYSIPVIELNGIGEENWTSNSGYKGTTYYFFENKRGEIFTFTKAIATYYDNMPRRNYIIDNNVAPWGLKCKLEELDKIHFKLKGGKVNLQNRISSSNESRGDLIGLSDIASLNLERYKFDNWEKVIDSVFLNKKKNNENYNLVFLEGNKFGESKFDNITQTFTLEIKDKDENVMEINIKFSLEKKHLIKTLERLYKRGKVPMFFGRVYIDEGKIKFYPISYFRDNEIESLT